MEKKFVSVINIVFAKLFPSAMEKTIINENLPPDEFFIGVTILLSLTVFLNLVAETLPQVSDAIPLLGREQNIQQKPIFRSKYDVFWLNFSSVFHISLLSHVQIC